MSSCSNSSECFIWQRRNRVGFLVYGLATYACRSTLTVEVWDTRQNSGHPFRMPQLSGLYYGYIWFVRPEKLLIELVWVIMIIDFKARVKRLLNENRSC